MIAPPNPSRNMEAHLKIQSIVAMGSTSLKLERAGAGYLIGSARNHSRLGLAPASPGLDGLGLRSCSRLLLIGPGASANFGGKKMAPEPKRRKLEPPPRRRYVSWLFRFMISLFV